MRFTVFGVPCAVDAEAEDLGNVFSGMIDLFDHTDDRPEIELALRRAGPDWLNRPFQVLGPDRGSLPPTYALTEALNRSLDALAERAASVAGAVGLAGSVVSAGAASVLLCFEDSIADGGVPAWYASPRVCAALLATDWEVVSHGDTAIEVSEKAVRALPNWRPLLGIEAVASSGDPLADAARQFTPLSKLGRVADETPLDAIAIVSVGGREPVLDALTPTNAMRRLVANAHGLQSEVVLDSLAEMAERLPAFAVSIPVDDVGSVGAQLRTVLETIERPSHVRKMP